MEFPSTLNRWLTMVEVGYNHVMLGENKIFKCDVVDAIGSSKPNTSI